MTELPYRQIHLDFHTSPFITDVGSEFDAEAFVKTLKEARVNSINVFAKCHHGMCYYPTKLGKAHPALKFDLLGEMLNVLHREGIKAPIYFPVGWEEEAADDANWLEVNKDGVLGTITPFEDEYYKWRKLCLNKKGYIDYILAQTQELIDRYEVDGFWYDIIFQKHCVCKACIEDMSKAGLDPRNEEDVIKHDFLALEKFQQTVFRYVKEKKPDALVFFNGKWVPDGAYESQYSINRRKDIQTHMEIESLPSGYWGYNHFPLFVNFHNKNNGEIIGMNGKFHTAWGDFGTLRNKEALEFECFRMIASGSKVCIGDQLHPRGQLDPSSYKRIGEIFAEIEAREPWCVGSRKVSEIGVLLANRPLAEGSLSDEGAMRMLLELHHAFDLIDFESDFSPYKLLILPDDVVCHPEHARKISEYVRQGGKVLATHHSGLNTDKTAFAVKELGVEYLGEDEFEPAYIRLGDKLGGTIEPMDYALYHRGALVRPQEGAETLAQLGQPYFNRTFDRFCSHRQFPFDRLTDNPAAVRHGNVIYLSHPLFRSYILDGVKVYKDIIANSILSLLEEPILVSDLPATAEVTFRTQDNRSIVHILHYIAERKCKTVDIVDTRIPLYNRTIKLRTDMLPAKVYAAPSMQPLDYTQQGAYVSVNVPEIDGHTMIVLEA
jgi:hypothetical protein